MATLLEKVTTLISANLHALVDEALKTNSLAVIDSYIRQVEDQLENLEDAAATVGGEIRSIKRKLEEQMQKAAELDKAVDAFLAEGNDDSAVATQSRLNSTVQLIDTYKEQLAKLEVEYQKLLNAKVKLEARHATMKQQRTELQALLELAKSKEIALKAMKGLDDIMGSGDTDISRIAQGIYSRLDKATAATDIRASSLDKQIDDLLDRDTINQQLAERKKKLETKK
ncbi:MAG: PspA/IM30 family protein [Anaerolineae bacterium]|nr:PspA/IM30 family protein [Anaerolineae bacterium]